MYQVLDADRICESLGCKEHPLMGYKVCLAHLPMPTTTTNATEGAYVDVVA